MSPTKMPGRLEHYLDLKKENNNNKKRTKRQKKDHFKHHTLNEDKGEGVKITIFKNIFYMELNNLPHWCKDWYYQFRP